MKENPRAVTLLELLIVVIVVGILATLAISSFFGPTEKARESEATANLKLIAAAEKIYRLENGQYRAFPGATEINQVLRLTLPVDGKHWIYSVSVGGTNNSTFTAKAVRIWTKSEAKNYTMTQDDDEPQKEP